MTVYVVTTDADSGAGSLRNAIAAAQTGDVIEFSGSLDDSTITLQSSLTIANGVTIDGGGDKITISGDDKYTDFVVSNLGAGGPATLEGLTIANGDGVGSTGAAAIENSPGGNGGNAAGGVMLSSGSLNLVDDLFNNDTATGGAGGAAHDTGGGFFEQPAGNGGNAAGALYSEGVITASNLTFSNDTATPGQPGAPYPGEVTETAGDAYPISNIVAFVDPTVFTVTTDADSGAGSLRAALAQATPYDTINFAPSLDNSTITLQSSLTIAYGVTIDGIGDNITISGAGKYSDFIVSNASTSEPVTLEGLTIANGVGWGSVGAAATGSSPGGNGGDAAGGVMLSSGSLDLVDDAFNNDTATGGAGGAAWGENLAKPGEAAGNGGNAAGAVYVEAGATVWASNLAFSNDTAHPGPGGAQSIVDPAGSAGAAYNITNDTAAESGVYTVTTDADGGVGSLRYALTEPQTGEIIKFASALDGQTITLQSSLTIANGDTIDGLGDDITISGADKYADFIVSNAGAGAPATLEGLTIADGNGVGSTGAGATVVAAGGNGGDAAGGLWLSDGAVNLVNDAFNNDTATGGTGGASSFETLYGGHAAGNGGNAAGAIYVEAGATVTATDLTFSGDTANAGQPGSNASGGGAGSAGNAYAISNSPYVDSGVYTATTDADSGLGSLRAILADAQTGDWIKFAPSLDNSTLTLQSSLTIADGVTIDGFGDKITISGDGKDTDFIVANAGAGAPATLEGLIIANGGLDLSSGAVNLYNDAFNGGVLTFAAPSALAETFSLGAGSELIINSGDTLTLTGTTSLAGTTSGAGTLDLSGGGSTSIDSGAKISVSAWSLLGSKTSATLNENLAYAGTFGEAAGDTLDLSGGFLLLTGSDTFSGGTVDGANRLYADGTTLITDGLTIAGTASLENQKTLTQSGGAVTVGDNAGNKAELYNASTGTYAIADDSGIGRGSSTASFIVNAGLFKKTGGTETSAISASFTDTGTVTVASGTLSFSGPSNSFAGAITGAGTVQFAGGSTTLKSGASASVAALSETNAGTTLTIAENLSYGDDFTQGAGSTLSVSSGDTLTLTGTTSLAGTTSGLGTLDLSGGGSTSIDSGAKISVSAWSLLGSKTSATLNENLGYAGTFGEAADDTLDLSGGSLTLTGSDTFSGGTIDGSNRLYAQGTTLITDGLTIGGTASLENQKTLTQSGVAVTIGDNAGNKAELYNASTGTYAIADNSGIDRGSSTASFIVNTGLFEKTGGAETSTIAPVLTNTGTVLVSSGGLDLQGAVSGTGADTISGASTLEFDATVASGQTIGFTGAGGTLDLGDPQGFSGKISGFDTVGSNDQLEIAAPWTYLRFSENAAETQGTLTFASGASQISLTLLGNYADDFIHQAGPGGSTLVTYK